MKKQEILSFIEKNRKLYKKEELEKIICSKFSLEPYEFNSLYNYLIDKGLILKNKKNQIISAKKNQIYKGKIIGHERGFAFCVVLGMDDFFIAPRNLNGALNGDIVLIKAFNDNKNAHSTEAEVIKIIERNNTTIVGTFFSDKKQSFVKPDNTKINGVVKVNKNFIAKNGEKVVVKITNTKSFSGDVIEVLGDSDDLETLELGIIREHKLYEVFPEPVIPNNVWES